MSAPRPVQIAVDEEFEHLPRAPIVEAVIDLRARPSQKLEEAPLREQLEAMIEPYEFLDSQREYQGEMRLEGGKPPSQNFRDLGWKGLRFRSTDEKHIAQFNRDGFVFSRLEPYQNWRQFETEALRLWSNFRSVAQPVEIHRLGLRFINRIQLQPADFRFEDYIRSAPAPPCDFELPFYGFMHQDMLGVPGHPYAINVIRTIQPSLASIGTKFAIIIDIDVSTTQGSALNEATMGARLAEMRWLKNKVFFGSVTEKALEGFR
jgi:uncharacterized protein (TIGR04255 family)